MVRQRAQQDAVDDGEYCGVGADAKRQCEEGHGGEGRRLAQSPHGVAKILKESFDEANAARVAALLLDLIETSKFDAHAALRLIRRDSGGKVFLKLLLDVKAQLVVQFGV